MRVRELIEAVSVNGWRIYEIRTRNQFLAAVRRHPHLRGFVQPNQIIAWDAEGAVHPDVRRETGDFGIPVQMDATRIWLRPHGFQIVYIKQMYRDLIAAPVIKRVYGGALPAIHLDDEYVTDYDRIDNLGWETETEDDRDEAEGHWRQLWGAY